LGQAQKWSGVKPITGASSSPTVIIGLSNDKTDINK
jgi:hypothetical protein